MPYLSKYHISEQYAFALLGPVSASLRELAQRTQHYADRVNMAESEQEALRRAFQAISTARAEVERIRVGIRRERGD